MVPLTSEHIVAAAGTESSQSVAKDKATDEEAEVSTSQSNTLHLSVLKKDK